MKATAPGASTRRLARPEASTRRRHLQAGLTVAALGAVLVASLSIDAPWGTPVALLAAGAGAGYSLSGSV